MLVARRSRGGWWATLSSDSAGTFRYCLGRGEEKVLTMTHAEWEEEKFGGIEIEGRRPSVVPNRGALMHWLETRDQHLLDQMKRDGMLPEDGDALLDYLTGRKRSRR